MSNNNNNQSPKPQMRWQPKANSVDGNGIQNNNKNTNNNSTNSQNKSKRIQRRNNKKNNNKNNNSPQNSNSSIVNLRSPSKTSDNNVQVDHNNSKTSNIEINDRNEQPVKNEPQKEENNVLYSVTPPDTFADHTAAQVPPTNFYPVLVPPNMPNTLHLEHVKDQIFSLLSVQTNVKNSMPNTSEEADNRVNNPQTLNNSPLGNPQFPSFTDSPSSPHILQNLNNSNDNPSYLIIDHNPCQSLPHSLNPNALDSPFPNSQTFTQTAPNNTIGNINMGNNGVHTGNNGNPFSHMNTNFPPFSFPIQLMNSDQPNLPSVNLQSNYPTFSIPNNHNAGNLMANDIQNVQTSFFHNQHMISSMKEVSAPSSDFPPTTTPIPTVNVQESENGDITLEQQTNNGDHLLQQEVSVPDNTTKEIEADKKQEPSESTPKNKKDRAKKKVKKRFVFDVFDAKMKIGLPPDYALSGIYITARARKILDKYAALCEKNYAKVTKTAESLFEELRPPKEDMLMRRELLQKIQKIILDYWPNDNAKLHLFGSSANDFCLKGGDIDMCLTIDRTDDQKVEVVEELGRLLVKHQMKDVTSLSGARVPIVKFTDPQSGYSCDICINNTLALQNTKLLAHYSKIDPRLKKLACVIKYWAKRRQINAPFAGTLSSYAYVLLIIHFLQRRDIPILPCLQFGIDNLPKVEVDGYDCTFQSENLNNFRINAMKNKQSLGKLVIDFFKFYGMEFDYVNRVISVRTGGYFTKEAKNWKKPKHNRESCFLGLEDPFEVTHNLGRVVDKRGIEIIRDEFERSFIILARKGDLQRVNKEYSEEDQDCNWR